MYNRRYEKVFLMLRQETAGYALGKRPPWGSCVMELKNGRGRLHLTAQGLRPFGYEVYVMAGEESIFCGEVCPEPKEGRCELKWDFDPDAIGEGKRAEDLHTVILLADGLSAPLTASFREKRDWKTDFARRKTEDIPLQAAEATFAEKPVQMEQADIHTKIAEEQKARCQDSIHGSFQGLLAKFRQELEELEETGILTREETEHIRNMGATVKEEQEPLCSAEQGWVPFGDGKAWKRISPEEMLLFSQVPLKWEREFFFLLPCRKYHHLILREEEKGLWLGVPQKYDERDIADAEKFGFREFRRVADEWGYWLTFLEGNS